MTPVGGRRWRLVRARTDAVPASWRRLMARTRRPRARGRRWAVVAVTAVLAVAVGWTVWASPLLAVTEVRVTGTYLLSAADVHLAAGVPEGTPLARVRTGDVVARVSSLPPVAQVEVRRDWPRTLELAVTERSAVAAVPRDGRFGLLDGTGLLFHTVSSVPPQLPLLEVSDPAPDDPATGAALVVLDSLTPELRAQLHTLSVAGPARIRLELGSGRTVVWGDESASEEKARVATALLDRDVDEIDVSAPEVVVLR